MTITLCHEMPLRVDINIVEVAIAERLTAEALTCSLPPPLTVRTMKSGNPRDEEDDFPALGATAAAAM